MTRVQLARHVEIGRDQHGARWFNAGVQSVSDDDAALLRGRPGVVFLDEVVAPSPPAPLPNLGEGSVGGSADGGGQGGALASAEHEIEQAAKDLQAVEGQATAPAVDVVGDGNKASGAPVAPAA